MCQVHPVSRITGERRGIYLEGVGAWVSTRRTGGAGGEQAGQLSLCTDTINPSRKGENLEYTVCIF